MGSAGAVGGLGGSLLSQLEGCWHQAGPNADSACIELTRDLYNIERFDELSVKRGGVCQLSLLPVWVQHSLCLILFLVFMSKETSEFDTPELSMPWGQSVVF